MNAIVSTQHTSPATAQEIRAQVQRIQQVMRAVMKDKVHYGIVPGTPKPSLWKPGAEVLAATFHIAVSYRTDDLSDSDCVRYRVAAIGTHQGTGITMGEGMGEASSNEEKYKWKAAAGDREFEATDSERRRIKWRRGDRGEYETKQVRSEPADVANTILKMACKRAQVAMILNVTAASDCFTQDLEDLPDGVREAVVEGDGPPANGGKPATVAPKTNGGKGFATPAQLGLIRRRLDASGVPENELLKHFALVEIAGLPFGKVDECLAWIAAANAG